MLMNFKSLHFIVISSPDKPYVYIVDNIGDLMIVLRVETCSVLTNKYICGHFSFDRHSLSSLICKLIYTTHIKFASYKIKVSQQQQRNESILHACPGLI